MRSYVVGSGISYENDVEALRIMLLLRAFKHVWPNGPLQKGAPIRLWNVGQRHNIT